MLHNHTLVSHTLANKHPFCPIMAQQQPPVPNIATLQAAVNIMTAEGNTVQAYNCQGRQALPKRKYLAHNVEGAQA